MNSLLKRQIRKYLPDNLQSNKELEIFLDAVGRSYTTADNQFAMLQRATVISSEELFDANEKLKEETNSQRKVINKLKSVIDTLKFYGLEQNNPTENSDSLKLVDFIDNQTKEIIKINQQKDSLLKSLEQQNQELNDYAHMISHDLKTPIQNIEALSVWLKEDSQKVLDSEGKERIELIRENTQKIDTLVKAIHTYSTIDKEKQKRSNLDLDKLLKTILKEFNLSENINVHIPEKLPNIKSDKDRMEQLFFNLIDNAIKFNDKENINIEIGFSDENTFWKFYVKDNGKGIDKKYFQRIFVAFSKLENDYKSAGIGLSIAKKIVDVYKGDIWIESELNEGSTFYFTIKK
ncbi:GHKL domain-containing protein [Tenacibaculum sp. AHE15PA]|uniref:sensor histidine kinase n=1 Tax=unclassified Tenacibaculum TaxID=2635139 RepID=UPI001C5007B0|nr:MULTISPECIES: ATP-binding protein [unclassified Tenacibaculum]QXP73677.1 GHKL domain-containing protein [Tenacibaculum sp. AHE14PA]QXP75956.1 GHKL domain-containing protein [Tenacibaculum sp. AHE15PA]